jgi:hypothetical protein
MKLSILAGSTSQTVNVFIRSSASTTGAGLTGLVYNTASLTAYYGLSRAAAVSISLGTQTATGAWSSGGFVEISSANMPGWYRFDIPNAALASGRFVSIHLQGAANMAPCPIEIELTATNNQSATAFITGVNSLAPPTNWNLLSVDSNGRVDVIKVAGTSQTARDLGANIDTTISSRSSHTAADVWAAATRTLSAFAFSVTASSVSDKTGYALTSAYDPAKTAAQAGDAMALTSGERTSLTGVIWAALTSGLTTVSSIGKLLVDDINATISSRSTYAGGDTSGTTTLLSRISAAVTITGGKVDVNDKTGFALTSAYDPAKTAAQAGDAMALTSGERTTLAASIWNALTSGLTTVASIGKLLVDNVNATISSRLASSSYTAPDNTGIAAIQAKTDNLPAAPAATSDIPSAASIRAEMDSNSTKLANLDAAVSTRSTFAGGAVASVTAPVALTSAYDAAKTAAQPSDVPTTSEITEAILKRKIVWNTGTGQFDVYDAAGSTVAFSLQPTTDPTADPIVGIEEA